MTRSTGRSFSLARLRIKAHDLASACCASSIRMTTRRRDGAGADAVAAAAAPPRAAPISAPPLIGMSAPRCTVTPPPLAGSRTGSIVAIVELRLARQLADSTVGLGWAFE
eukprot:6192432-Pleurochrysis_carterae.AAC.2